ncbi:uncharacterized protein LOC113874721 [Abrus precatorius]|uniref:Uncharacterized protein LOC113874721 n=1 Tax=Abrus precatorius TaxID=3816 RepID=A0A8B8MMA1_ABRPR|nr:uncharacterized protein LOC113874721 [Abrus precatorius]
MNVSPLEAQAFNYLSFGFFTFLNNIWTRLALSFWRIPTPNSQLPPPSAQPEPDPNPDTSEPDAVSVSGNVDVDGVTKSKGKFTLYYEDDGECSKDEMVTVTEEDWEDREGEREWWESWERVLRMRAGENEKGWYTCQDLTVLNGSVVKLWEWRDSSNSVILWY